MKDKIKDFAKKFGKRLLVILPWTALIAFGVYFASIKLAEWHYNEFIAPFLK